MRRLVLIVGLVAVAACHNDPIKPVPVPGNPCGYGWDSCGNHMCCPETSDCGGVVLSCPAGMCCYHGSTTMYGARMVKQRPEQPK